jgi:hypothetical protein
MTYKKRKAGPIIIVIGHGLVFANFSPEMRPQFAKQIAFLR